MFIKSPHLLQFLNIMLQHCFAVKQFSISGEFILSHKLLRHTLPDQILYWGQSRWELYDHLNPREYSLVWGPDRQPQAAMKKRQRAKWNTKHVNSQQTTPESTRCLDCVGFVTLCRCSNANAISPLYKATSCSLNRTLCTRCVNSSPPFT